MRTVKGRVVAWFSAYAAAGVRKMEADVSVMVMISSHCQHGSDGERAEKVYYLY